MSEQEQKAHMPVSAVSLESKCALLEDGTIVPFEHMYDAEGEETEDVEAAVTAVAPHPDGVWIVIQLGLLAEITVH